MPALPVTFRSSPLPANFKGTPQQFLDAIVARLAIESQTDLSFFTTGSVAPTSDSGPWLKNGTTWYVWDVVTGSYVPEVIEFSSLRYVASMAAPDQAKYTFWIELNGAGKAQSVKYFSGGSWKDIYEDKFATYSTTTAMNSAIAAAVAAQASKPSPACARMSVSQSVLVDTTAYKIEYDTIVFDPSGSYNAVSFRYVAPNSGYYLITADAQVDNDTATPSGMEITFIAAKNGIAQSTCISGVSVASPPGDRWYPRLSGMMQLTAGDYVEIFMSLNDGVNTGAVDVANADWSIHMVQAA